MRYSDDIIEEVRQKNDIVDVVSQYVRLTRRGSTYFGLWGFCFFSQHHFTTLYHRIHITAN